MGSNKQASLQVIHFQDAPRAVFCAALLFLHLRSNLRARFRRLSIALPLALLLAFAVSLSAQTVQFFGPFQSYSQSVVSFPQAIVANAAGDLYVSGTYNLGYVPVDANGNPIASGEVRFSSTGSTIMGMAIDSANNIYRADAGAATVQKYTYNGGPTTFTYSTIGSGWSTPGGVTVDGNSNVYVLDAGPGSIVKLSPNGSGGYNQTVLYTNATLKNTTGLSLDAGGNFYVASGTNYGSGAYTGSVAAVYKVTNNGGSYSVSSIGSGWNSPSYTVVDGVGNIWVADLGAGEIVLLVPSGNSYIQVPYQSISGVQSLNVSKTGRVYGFSGQIWVGGSAPHYLGSYNVGSSSPTLSVTVAFVSVATAGGFNVSTQGASSSDFSVVTGGTCAPGSFVAEQTCTVQVAFKPSAAGLREGAVVVTDNSGNVLGTNYLYGVGLAPLAALTPGLMTTVAGTGTACSTGSCGDGGTAASAMLNTPIAALEDPTGNVYVADSGSYRVRKVDTSGNITTMAGTGAPCGTTSAACGDGGQASSALLKPIGLALDGAGNLYISDDSTGRVRAVNLSSGVITTVAGNGTQCASPTATCGDGGAATSANLNSPIGLAVDGSGHLLIADSSDNRVRSVDLSAGIITTIAGTGTACTPATAACGDGGPASSADLNKPLGVAVDAAGNYYIADTGTSRIREISSLTSTISTVAGTGTPCSSAPCGDGSAATSASLNFPVAVAVDPAGNIYIADAEDNAIREVSAANSKITTVAGNFTACTPVTAACGDGGSATAANLNSPSGFALDTAGDLLIADYGTNRLREVNVATTGTLSFAAATPGSESSDSPKTVDLGNIGNATLTVSAPQSGTNPAFPSGFQSDTGVTNCAIVTATPASLSSGGYCALGIDFVPSTGSSFSGSVAFTDNSGGTAGATQTIPVSGTSRSPVTQLAFTTSPAATLTAGGNAGSSIVVAEEDSGGATVASATDTITINVSGQGTYSASYTATAISGVATFNLSTDLLTAAGAYTYTALIVADPSVTTASANESVNAASAAAVGASAGGGQSTVIGAAFATSLKVNVTDTYSNPVGSVAVLFSAPASGASAGLSGSGAATTDSSGNAAVIATANALAGSYKVSASVNGVSLPATFSLTNTQATPTVSVVPSPAAPIAYGQAQTSVAATVSYAIGTPSGSVSFTNGGNAFGSAVTLSGGSATLAAQYLSAGTYAFRANYGGDANFTTATNTVSVAYTVNKAGSTLSGPATQPVTLSYGNSGSATIGVAGQFSGTGIATPSGQLSYSLVASTGGSAVASGSSSITSGAAVIPLPSTLSAGMYTLTVTYAGDSNYNAASTLAVSVQVGQAQPTITWPTPSSIAYGTTVSASLDASAMNGSSTVAGTYAYTATPSGGSSSAVTGTSVLAAGSYTLGVTFTPTDSTDFKMAKSTVALVVTKATPGVALQSSLNPALSQNAVTLTASVTSTISIPTGTVTFYDGNNAIGSAVSLNSSGVASLTTSALTVGSHSVTAVYSGDANFVTGTSNTVAELVEDFDLTISVSSGGSGSSTTSVTVVPGQSATYNLVVSPVAPATIFPTTIQLSASGLPPGANYTITPQSIPAGSGSTNLTLTVTTLTSAASRGAPHQRSLDRSAPFVLALLFLPFVRRMRRGGKHLSRFLGGVLLLALSAAALAGLSGCSQKTGFFGQAPQTFTISVTGTSGNLSHSASVTLTIE